MSNVSYIKDINLTLYFERNENYLNYRKHFKVKTLSSYHYYTIDTFHKYYDYEYFDTIVLRTKDEAYFGKKYDNFYDILGIYTDSFYVGNEIRFKSRKIITEDKFKRHLSRFTHSKINYNGPLFSLLKDKTIYNSVIESSWDWEKKIRWNIIHEDIPYYIIVENLGNYEFNVTTEKI